MDYLRIANWKKWQSYRSDRNQPPWIKVHRCLMRNPEWVELTDAQRGQLLSIWLLAADKGGSVPASATVIQKLCHLTKAPDLNRLIDLGFLEHDANMTPTWRQPDATVTPQTRLDKTRLDKKELLSCESHTTPQKSPKKRKQQTFTTEVENLFAFLNDKTGKAFEARRPDGKLTSNGAMLQNLLRAGYTEQDVKTVVARKTREWKSDANMVQYLRPATLFAPRNFENYKGECIASG